MHADSEIGNACHQDYKDKTDITDIEMKIDRKKISIPGYVSSENLLVLDLVGFERSLQILQRQKTF